MVSHSCQGHRLIRAIKAYFTTSIEALEVLCGVQSIKLRLEEVLVSQFLNILCKPEKSPLHTQISSLSKDTAFMDHRLISPTHSFTSLSQVIKHDRTNKIN